MDNGIYKNMNKTLLIGTKMNHGGAQIELIEIAKMLEYREIPYKLIGGTGTINLEEFLKTENFELIHFSRPMSLKELFSYFFLVYNQIKNIKPNYIFCSGPIACYFGLFIGKIFGIKKRVYRVSGCTISSGNSRITNLRNYLLEKVTFFFSTHSYFVSVFNMHKYNKIRLQSGFNASIPTIIDFPEVEIKKSMSSKIRFGYLGNLQKEKGIKVVLNIFNDIDSSKYELHIAGDGGLKNFVEEACNKNINYKYHGIVEPYKFLNNIDVLVMPTLYMEGLPQVISQAIVSSCIVIAYNHEGIPEEVIDSFNGLLVSKTPMALKDAILNVINDPELLHEMKKNASLMKEFIKKKHSGDQLINKIIYDINS